MIKTLLLLLVISILWVVSGKILDNHQIIEQHYLWMLYGYFWGIIVEMVFVWRTDKL